MSKENFVIKEKQVEDMIIAGYRVKGRYEEMGKYFTKLFQEFQSEVREPSFSLYYDQGYQEVADYEVCFPVSEIRETEEFSVRELEGGKCVSLYYKGSYDLAVEAWTKVFDYIKSKGYQPLMPTREVYLVCSQSTDNPEEYETEIQVLVKE